MMNTGEANKRMHGAAASGAVAGGIVGIAVIDFILNLILFVVGTIFLNFFRNGAAGYMFIRFFSGVTLAIAILMSWSGNEAGFGIGILVAYPFTMSFMTMMVFEKLESIKIGPLRYVGIYNIGFFASILTPIPAAFLLYVLLDASPNWVIRGLNGALDSVPVWLQEPVGVFAGHFVVAFTVWFFIRKSIGFAVKKFIRENPQDALEICEKRRDIFPKNTPDSSKPIIEIYAKRIKKYATGTLPVWIFSTLIGSMMIMLLAAIIMKPSRIFNYVINWF